MEQWLPSLISTGHNESKNFVNVCVRNLPHFNYAVRGYETPVIRDLTKSLQSFCYVVDSNLTLQVSRL